MTPITGKDIINFDRETKAICIFLPGNLKNRPFGIFFIINQKLQVSQNWKPDKIPLPVIGVTCMYCKNWLSNGHFCAGTRFFYTLYYLFKSIYSSFIHLLSIYLSTLHLFIYYPFIYLIPIYLSTIYLFIYHIFIYLLSFYLSTINLSIYY